MLIRIDNITVINTQQLVRIYVRNISGLAPDQVDEMKDELDYYKDEYNDIQARYDKLFHHMEELGCQI